MKATLLHWYRVARGETPATRPIKRLLYVLLVAIVAAIFVAVIWATWDFWGPRLFGA